LKSVDFTDKLVIKHREIECYSETGVGQGSGSGNSRPRNIFNSCPVEVTWYGFEKETQRELAMDDEQFFCCVLRMVSQMGGELVGYNN